MQRLLEVLALGDVAEGGHDPADAWVAQQVGGDDLEVAPGVVDQAQPHLGGHAQARAAERLGDQAARHVAVVRVDEVEEAGVLQRIGRVAPDPRGRRAVEVDRAVDRQDRDDVRGVQDQRAEALLGLPAGALGLLERCEGRSGRRRPPASCRSHLAARSAFRAARTRMATPAATSMTWYGSDPGPRRSASASSLNPQLTLQSLFRTNEAERPKVTALSRAGAEWTARPTHLLDGDRVSRRCSSRASDMVAGHVPSARSSTLEIVESLAGVGDVQTWTTCAARGSASISGNSEARNPSCGHWSSIRWRWTPRMVSWLRAASSGDDAAWHALISRYARLVEAIIRRYHLPPEERSRRLPGRLGCALA